MNLSEAMKNPAASQSMAGAGIMRQIHCAMPGTVISYDAEQCTAVIQPAIKGMLGGVMQPLPEVECPVFMPGGLLIPVEAGDECLVIFADTSIDSWWASGGIQSPSSLRRHSLSDGFALVGFFSRPRAAQQHDEIASKSWVIEEIRKAMEGGATE